jgi:hypothetical protein
MPIANSFLGLNDVFKGSVYLDMDFLIDGQISSFCPDQLEAMLLTLIMLHKLT